MRFSRCEMPYFSGILPIRMLSRWISKVRGDCDADEIAEPTKTNETYTRFYADGNLVEYAELLGNLCLNGSFIILKTNMAQFTYLAIFFV